MPIISPTAISPHRIGKKFDWSSYWATQPLTAVVENADATKIIITFTKALDESSVPAITAFAVYGKTVSDVDIANNVLTLTVSAAFIYGDGVHVQYTPPAANPLQTSENVAPSWYIAATNNIIYILPSANLKFDYFGGDGSSIPAEITITDGYVTAIADKTANHYDLAEVGAGNTTHELSVEGSGRGALVMGGTTYFLRTIEAAVLANSTSHTIIAVYISKHDSQQTLYMEGLTTSQNPLFRGYYSGTYFNKQHRDDAGHIVFTSLTSANFVNTEGTVHILCYRRNGTSHQLIVDGQPEVVSVADIGATSVNRMGFGAHIYGSTIGQAVFVGKLFAVIGYEDDNYSALLIPISRYYNARLGPLTISISFSSSIDTI